MAKKVRTESAAVNGPAMHPAHAAAAGNMLAELLCLDTRDAGAVEAFDRRHGLYLGDRSQALGHVAALFAAALAELRDGPCRAEVFDAARACFVMGVTEARAKVRRIVGRMIFRRADIAGWILDLARCDPRFAGLREDPGRVFMRALIDRARGETKKKGRKVSAGYVAAALSLRVKAFDDAMKPGETDAAACRRVAKDFDRAFAKTAEKKKGRTRAVSRNRPRRARSSSAKGGPAGSVAEAAR